MKYVLICKHCGSRIATTERVGDAEVAPVESHLRADHPETLPTTRRLDFAEMLAQVRVKMGER